EDGYLEFVRDRHPNWDRQVESLERNHDRLYARLRQLHRRISENEWIGPVANDLREELTEWMDALLDHNHLETVLISEAANLDVGVAG
ncbi:MAG: hypothetical protein NT069_16585, partial [Planctomycetota bacterium]|nr:hypothetical protein [Planctomycetota bacterium]